MNKREVIHTTILVLHIQEDQYGLYWSAEDGRDEVYICNAYGFENAIRVANGIAHNHVEFVTHPPFMSEWEQENEAEIKPTGAEAPQERI